MVKKSNNMDVQEAYSLLLGEKPKKTDLEKAYDNLLEKAVITASIDASHGGKLVKKTIIDKTGKKTAKWVRREQSESSDGKKKKEPEIKQAAEKELQDRGGKVSGKGVESGKSEQKKESKIVDKTEKTIKTKGRADKSNPTREKKEQWYDAIVSRHKLNRLPVNILQSEVKVDESDPLNHWIMQWKDPKTGKQMNAYTKEFLDRNAEKKWLRVEKISTKSVEIVKQKTAKHFKDQDDDIAQSAAIIHIIASTGLRPGDRTLFKQTGNRGVSTLHPDNVEIDGDTVSFNFTGKSYKNNLATIKNQDLADYLSVRKIAAKMENNEFLFDIGKEKIVDAFRNEFGFKGFKLKDLRTYIACNIAKDILFGDKTPPPPLPEKKSQIKKAVRDKLKICFEKVSQQLNNTPAMAKTSYIHPNIINAFIVQLGLQKDEILKAEEVQNDWEIPSLSDIAAKAITAKTIANDDDTDDESLDPDEYWWPDWMEEDEDTEEAIEKAITDALSKNNKIKIIELLKKYKGEEVPDSKIHNLAENIGIEPDKLESFIYSLASQAVSGLKGGKGDDETVKTLAKKHGVTEKEIQEQFQIGEIVELEHIGENKDLNDEQKKHIARKIAADHIEEISDYYTRLNKMEEEAKNEYAYMQYMSESLGKKREDLPQIDPENIEDYIAELKKQGIKVKKTKKPLKELKPSQDDINEDKLLKMMKSKYDWENRDYIVSSDNYLIDAHHSWSLGIEKDPKKEVNVYVIDLPINKLIKESNKSELTKNKDINDKVLIKAEELPELLENHILITDLQYQILQQQSEELSPEFMEKAQRDLSKLLKKIIINKEGDKQVVWVKPLIDLKVSKEIKKLQEGIEDDDRHIKFQNERLFGKDIIIEPKLFEEVRRNNIRNEALKKQKLMRLEKLQSQGEKVVETQESFKTKSDTLKGEEMFQKIQESKKGGVLQHPEGFKKGDKVKFNVQGKDVIGTFIIMRQDKLGDYCKVEYKGQKYVRLPHKIMKIEEKKQFTPLDMSQSFGRKTKAKFFSKEDILDKIKEAKEEQSKILKKKTK